MAQASVRILEPLTAEQRFRRWASTQDRRLMILLVSIVTLAVATFALLDVIFFDDSSENGWILCFRAGVIMSSLAFIGTVRRPRPPRIFDRHVVIWLASLLAMQLVVAVLRPAGWSPVQIVNMLIVMGAYTLLPVPTRLTAVPVLAFSAVNLLILALNGAAFGRIGLATAAAYVVGNVVGLIVLRRFQSLRRRQFRVLERERGARRRLRAALDEVKVLRGIVPICTVCKKIRNDDGLYEAVEAYVARHSEADFSHTLCPSCLRDKYPDEARLLSP